MSLCAFVSQVGQCFVVSLRLAENIVDKVKSKVSKDLSAAFAINVQRKSSSAIPHKLNIEDLASHLLNIRGKCLNPKSCSEQVSLLIKAKYTLPQFLNGRFFSSAIKCGARIKNNSRTKRYPKNAKSTKRTRNTTAKERRNSIAL